MARRPSLLKVKAKAKKKSRSEQYLINLKAFGDEPVYTSKLLTPLQLTTYYNWYNYMSDAREAKEYLITYLRNTGRDTEAKKVNHIPDKYVPTTIAWIARMRSLGANVPETSREYFETRLQTALLDGQRMAKEGQSEPDGNGHNEKPESSQKPSVQDRVEAKYDFLASQIEEECDKFIETWIDPFSMIDWLKSNDVSNAIAKRLHTKYEPQLLEIENAYTTDDKEGWEDLAKSDKLKKLYGFFVMIVEDLELHMQNEKKVRKTRTPKPITAEKKLKDFKYLKFDNVHNIQSVQPERLLGAAEIWIFNTKYNQLTVFRMDDPQVGLDVHRTAIIKYDPKTSTTKKLKANKVDAALKEVLSAGKVALRKTMETFVGSDQRLQERMNENTIILRVVAR